MKNGINKISVIVSLFFGILLLSSCTDTEVEKENEVSENNFIEHEASLEENTNVVNTENKSFDLYNYVPYSQSEIKDSKKLNVLFFNDSESESIKILKDNLMITKIHDGLVMYAIDFNTDIELKAKYNVTEAHSFVQVDNELNIIRKWEGSETIGEMHTALTSTKTMVK